MSYLLLDDGFSEHPKISPLTDKAFRLHVTGLAYCARNLTDGEITGNSLRSVLATAGASKRHVIELEKASLWRPISGGNRIHDYLKHNPSSEKVKTDREAARERMRRLRSGERSDARSGEQTANVREKFGDPIPLPSPKERTSLPQDVLRPDTRRENHKEIQGSTLDQIIEHCQATDPNAKQKILRTHSANNVPEAKLLEILYAIKQPDTRDRTGKTLAMMSAVPAREPNGPLADFRASLEVEQAYVEPSAVGELVESSLAAVACSSCGLGAGRHLPDCDRLAA